MGTSYLYTAYEKKIFYLCKSGYSYNIVENILLKKIRIQWNDLYFMNYWGNLASNEHCSMYTYIQGHWRKKKQVSYIGIEMYRILVGVHIQSLIGQLLGLPSGLNLVSTAHNVRDLVLM